MGYVPGPCPHLLDCWTGQNVVNLILSRLPLTSISLLEASVPEDGGPKAGILLGQLSGPVCSRGTHS